MSLYLYGVLGVEDLSACGVTGIQQQPVKIVGIEGLRIIASEFGGTSLIPTKQNIFSHEHVLESLMDHTTPLPFRFGTVVSQEKLHDFIRTNRDRLQADLDQVRGCVEMGLKILASAESAPEAPQQSASGTEFLRSKQRRHLQLRDTATWVDAAVAGVIRRSDVSSVDGTAKLLIRIAHLVPREALSEYKVQIALLVRQRTDYRFLSSGPWPPYSFVSTSYAG